MTHLKNVSCLFIAILTLNRAPFRYSWSWHNLHIFFYDFTFYFFLFFHQKKCV